MLAGIAIDIVLDLQARVPAGFRHEQLAEALPYGPRVRQVTGMVAAQLHSPVQKPWSAYEATPLPPAARSQA